MRQSWLASRCHYRELTRICSVAAWPHRLGYPRRCSVILLLLAPPFWLARRRHILSSLNAVCSGVVCINISISLLDVQDTVTREACTRHTLHAVVPTGGKARPRSPRISVHYPRLSWSGASSEPVDGSVDVFNCSCAPSFLRCSVSTLTTSSCSAVQPDDRVAAWCHVWPTVLYHTFKLS
jgi:hypothetical protein